MANELGDQMIQVTTRTTFISLSVLKSIIQSLLNNRYATVHGEQPLKKLNLQNRPLESVEITDKDIKAFRRQLNMHSVDFNVQKDKTTGHHTVYFKGQDVDRIHVALEKCIKNLSLEKSARQPFREVVANAIQKATERNALNQNPERNHRQDRGEI